MALFPCDEGNHRYPGRSQSMYLAVLDGGSSYRRKLRLCQRHFVQWQESLASAFVPSQEDFLGDNLPSCPQCGERVESGNCAAFVTVYAAGLDRADWWAPVHQDHVRALLARWGCEPEPPAMAPERLASQ